MVAPNVQRFRHERFTLWRCASCRSLHALESVDLPRQYQDFDALHAPEVECQLE